MKKKIWKTIIISFSVAFILFTVLCIHIYVMMKPKPADASTIAMARIDLHQNINQQDANKISTWLYNQKGVQHVLCNPQTKKIVFSFYPAKVSADNLTAALSSSLHYSAVRFKPSEKDMMAGCPMAASSFNYSIYNFIKNTF